MKLHFKDGYVKEVENNSKLIGVTHNGLRPIVIEHPANICDRYKKHLQQALYRDGTLILIED